MAARLEVRRDHPLDTVLDTDPKAVQQVTRHLARVIDFDIPGFGIDHDPTLVTSHADVHRHHKMLILKAVCLIDPPIDIESGFKKAALSNFLNGAGMHPDLVGHYPTLDRQKITLKLHTAETEGANVVLANAGLGDIWDIGDREDYDELSGIPCRSVIDYGYDYENSEGILEDSRRFQYESGSYDPIYSEPDFYQYQQGPYCSVLFRSLTTMGPASVHRFNAINPGVDRNVLVSQLDVLGQDHREAS